MLHRCKAQQNSYLCAGQLRSDIMVLLAGCLSATGSCVLGCCPQRASAQRPGAQRRDWRSSSGGKRQTGYTCTGVGRRAQWRARHAPAQHPCAWREVWRSSSNAKRQLRCACASSRRRSSGARAVPRAPAVMPSTRSGTPAAAPSAKPRAHAPAAAAAPGRKSRPQAPAAVIRSSGSRTRAEIGAPATSAGAKHGAPAPAAGAKSSGTPNVAGAPATAPGAKSGAPAPAVSAWSSGARDVAGAPAAAPGGAPAPAAAAWSSGARPVPGAPAAVPGAKPGAPAPAAASGSSGARAVGPAPLPSAGPPPAATAQPYPETADVAVGHPHPYPMATPSAPAGALRPSKAAAAARPAAHASEGVVEEVVGLGSGSAGLAATSHLQLVGPLPGTQAAAEADLGLGSTDAAPAPLPVHAWRPPKTVPPVPQRTGGGYSAARGTGAVTGILGSGLPAAPTPPPQIIWRQTQAVMPGSQGGYGAARAPPMGSISHAGAFIIGSKPLVPGRSAAPLLEDAASGVAAPGPQRRRRRVLEAGSGNPATPAAAPATSEASNVRVPTTPACHLQCRPPQVSRTSLLETRNSALHTASFTETVEDVFNSASLTLVEGGGGRIQAGTGLRARSTCSCRLAGRRAHAHMPCDMKCFTFVGFCKAAFAQGFAPAHPRPRARRLPQSRELVPGFVGALREQVYGPALDTMPPLTTQLPASPGDAPTRVFAFGGASLDHAPGAPFAYFTLLQPGQSAVGLSNPTLDTIAGDLAGDLAAHVAALAGGDPGTITVAAMPAPALGEQLLTVNGQPRPYAGRRGRYGHGGHHGRGACAASVAGARRGRGSV